MIKQVMAVCFGLLFTSSVFAVGSSAPTGNGDLDAKLADARARLEAAARDVAQLSSQLSGQLSEQLSGQIANATAEGMRGAAEGMRQAAEGMRALRTRAVLGLQLQTEPVAKDQGVRVMDVSPGGPAAEAGVHPGDVIVALNGVSTTGPQAPRELVERMQGVEPDSKVTLKLLRDGKPLTLTATARPVLRFAWTGSPWNDGSDDADSRGAFGGMLGRACGGASFLSGVELAPVSSHLGEYFGTDKGVLVVHAAQQGILQDGDVITAIDGRAPQSGAHAMRILCSYQPGEKLRLDLMRQKKAVVAFFVVPDSPRGRSGRPLPPAPPAPFVAPPTSPITGEPPIAVAPRSNIIPVPQSDSDDCLNSRLPPVEPMPGSQVPCIRLPNPLPPQQPYFVPLVAGN